MSGEVVILATPIYGVGLPPAVVERIESVGSVRVVPLSRDGVVHAEGEAALDAAEVLLRSGVPGSVLDHVLSRTPRLRWIHSASAGVDEVATPSVRSRGITLTNSRGVFSRPIAEYVVMMLFEHLASAAAAPGAPARTHLAAAARNRAGEPHGGHPWLWKHWLGDRRHA